MHPDVMEFYNFYQTISGQLVKRLLLETIDRLWQDLQKYTICGLGYADPYLDIFYKRNISCLSFQSSFSGIYRPDCGYEYPIIMMADNYLPLADNSQERILCTHLLEYTHSAPHFLQELSRILSPQGEALLIVPNRSGLWARSEKTPFGFGHPYSKSQLDNLLAPHDLWIGHYECGLFFHPKQYARMRIYVDMIEYLGKNSFLKHYAGVHIIKIVKRHYIPPKKIMPATNFLKILPPKLSHATREKIG